MTKRWLKRVVSLVLAFFMLLTGIIPVSADNGAERPTFAYQFEMVYENAYARMYLDRRNNAIRVVNRATGVYFVTLPMEAQMGNPLIQAQQRSDIWLDIVRDVRTGALIRMNSFTESVQRRQVEYTDIDGGIRAYMTLGDPDALHLTMFPPFITEERMNELVFDHITADDRSFIMDRYHLLDGVWMRILPTYNLVTGEPTTIAVPLLRRLWALFYEQGYYSFYELNYDNEYHGYDLFQEPPMVSIAIEYTLDGADLIVTIPRADMTFLESQPFRHISVLPYLVSGTTYDEGFLFVPDGSGGIIRFNNNMTTEQAEIPIFGRDLLVEGWVYQPPFEQATLPIFGMVRNDMGILAIIEEGAPVATVHANVSGRIDEYNRVFASFDLSLFEGLLLRGVGGAATSLEFLDVYDMDIRIRYVMVHGEDATYVGLARAYQNYLLERGLLRSNPMSADAPFFVDFYATTVLQRTFMGIPREHHYAMTSTQDAVDILHSMQAQGVRNIHAQYSHWANGGMHTTHLHNIRPLRTIGGRRGMRNMFDAFEDNPDVNIYPVVRASSVMMLPGRFGGVSLSMLALSLGNVPQTISWRVVNTRIFGGGSFLISPTYWLQYAQRIVRNLLNLGTRNVAVIDLGTHLFGTYGRRVERITRMDAIDYANNALGHFAGEMDGFMLHNPNVYGFAHATSIVNLPFPRVGRRIVDYYVPFVQWVLENHIPHALPPYNRDPMAYRGFTEYLLRAVESRSAMQLILTASDEEPFNATFVYSWTLNAPPFMTQYSRWENRIGAYYALYNEFYRAVYGADTVSHEVFHLGHHNGVRITYSNGVVVYINYSNESWDINGRSIQPLSFEIAS